MNGNHCCMSPNTPHRELTPRAVAFGVVVGLVLNASLTYAALQVGVMAFSASAVAAVASISLFRGFTGNGGVLECNIAQSVATAITSPTAGIVFTLPVLFMLGVELGAGSELFWCMTLASLAGAILGCAFIIPLRRRMIDLQRLHFPMGRAVSEILRASSIPGKASVLVLGCLAGALIYFPVVSPTLDFPAIGEQPSAPRQRLLGYGDLAGRGGSPTAADQAATAPAWITDDTLNLTELARLAVGDVLPRGMMLWIGISPLAFGAGYISGRKGLVLLFGGLLASCIILPVGHALGQTPPWLPRGEIGVYGHTHWNRPLGMGLLMGGALVAAWRAFPATRRSLQSLFGRTSVQNQMAARLNARDEMPPTIIVTCIALGMICLYAAVFYLQQSQPNAQGGWLGALGVTNPHLRAMVVTVIGGAWIWLAGLVATEAQSHIGWSPIAGVAVLTVALLMMLTGPADAAGAVLISAALCVAVSCAGDLMQNQRTGQRLGAVPFKQQAVHLFASTVAPMVSMLVLFLIVSANRASYGAPLGAATPTAAPQAQLLRDVIMGVEGPRAAPMAYYGLGSLMGGLLSAVALPSLGVLVGLSLYLPCEFLVTFGLGCVLHEALRRWKGVRWAKSIGGVFCAGLIVGESMMALTMRFAALISEVCFHG